MNFLIYYHNGHTEAAFMSRVSRTYTIIKLEEIHYWLLFLLVFFLESFHTTYHLNTFFISVFQCNNIIYLPTLLVTEKLKSIYSFKIDYEHYSEEEH